MNPEVEREVREYVTARQAALFRTALLLTGNREQAEDLLQAALIKVAMQWSKVRRADQPDAYVRRLLYHEQVTWWRRLSNQREHPTSQPPERAVPGDDTGAVDLRLSLAQALRQLTAKQRTVLVLRYYEDLPEAEIAAVMGCSVGTVRSQAHRSLARLRALYPHFAGPPAGYQEAST